MEYLTLLFFSIIEYTNIPRDKEKKENGKEIFEAKLSNH
jgi:hypothetical protein